MKKTEQFLTMPQGRIRVVLMEPEGPVRAVVQVVHGMKEHMGRYEEYGEFLCQHQVALVGHDHPGHGESVFWDTRSFFGAEQGMELVLDCMKQATDFITERFPEVPVFLLGHSMGSLFSRYYLTTAGARFAGAIIMGTSYQELPLVQAGRLLASLIMKVKGPRYVSPLLCQMVNGSFNKDFQDEGPNAWLSKNQLSVETYNTDPYCQYPFTCSAYHEMFRLLILLRKKEGITRIPKELPVLVVSGMQDPVGDYGKGVKKCYRDLSEVCLDCSLKLYETCRHEVLNDVERAQVYEDLQAWLEKYL